MKQDFNTGNQEVDQLQQGISTWKKCSSAQGKAHMMLQNMWLNGKKTLSKRI